ncbi:hypothetical protein Holit_02255 [Hollandina sp. SP2]
MCGIQGLEYQSSYRAFAEHLVALQIKLVFYSIYKLYLKGYKI